MNELSIGDAVSKVNGNPSLITIVIGMSLCFFKMLGPFMAYYPNFSGYIPYSDWRCNTSSEICLSRVGNFQESGWQQVNPDAYIFMDNRCRLQISNMEPTITINLYSSDKALFGELDINIRFNSMTTKLGPGCQENCSAKFMAQWPPFFNSTMVCELQYGSETSSFSCDNDLMASLRISNILKGAAKTVRYAEIEGAEIFQVICPEKSQYTRKNLCGEKGTTQLLPDTDFFWNIGSRTSYAIEWELYCGREYLATLLKSVFYVGAVIGLLLGGPIIDMYGRRFAAILGILCCILGIVVAGVSTSYWIVIAGRILQGLGRFVGSTALYILLLEFTDARHRVIVNTYSDLQWGLGYVAVAAAAYLLHGWKWILWLTTLLLVVSLVPVLFIPESPRFYFSNKNDEKRAKKSLQWLAKRNSVDINMDEIQLKKSAGHTDNISQWEVLKEFLKYREMTIQLIAQMAMWMIVSFLYFGFNYSWGKLGGDLYLSYMFAAVGEVIAYIGQAIPLTFIGRRKSMIIFFLVASSTFLLALIPVDLGLITLEQVSCLVGSMFVSAAFSSLYLYTVELAPDAQRGKILSMCSVAARLGSFLGPQASLMLEWNRHGTLVIFAVLAVLASIVPIRLPESRNVKAPATAAEIEERRKKKQSEKTPEIVE